MLFIQRDSNTELHHQVGRRLERRWRKSRDESDRTHYRAYAVAVRAAKKRHFSASIASSQCRPAELFRVVQGLVHPGPKEELIPPSKARCDDFAEHFREKIAQIRHELDSTIDSEVLRETPTLPSGPELLDEFQLLRPDDVDKVLGRVRPTTCLLDPCPSWLIKDSKHGIGTWILEVVNASLREGRVPAPLKEAVVRPVLKKASLDPGMAANYRPVANIPFLGKVLERVVAGQLQALLDETDYLDPFQSGFRPGYGTESALVALYDDLCREKDRGSASLLVLLDLSAAFDTIDHGILLDRLAGLGVGGTALRWFRSYLNDRFQKVVLGDYGSAPWQLCHGVPQGSILSPLLFNIYMKPLGEVIRRCGLRTHQYADDTQLYLSFSTNPGEAVAVLNRCLAEVMGWMRANKLKLNPDKTEVLLVGGSGFGEGDLNLVLNGVALPPRDKVRSLGVLLDPELSLEAQVTTAARSAFLQLRLIHQLRPYLEYDCLATVTHALVTSRLDFCNALYVGLPLKTVRILQLVQNRAARLLTGTGRYVHMTPVLRQLHWLPIEVRAQFKVLVMTYKALNGLGPGYLKERLHPYLPSRPLRSAGEALLREPSLCAIKSCLELTSKSFSDDIISKKLQKKLKAQLDWVCNEAVEKFYHTHGIPETLTGHRQTEEGHVMGTEEMPYVSHSSPPGSWDAKFRLCVLSKAGWGDPHEGSDETRNLGAQIIVTPSPEVKELLRALAIIRHQDLMDYTQKYLGSWQRYSHVHWPPFLRPRGEQLSSKELELADIFCPTFYTLNDSVSILESRDITLPTKVRIGKAMVFPVAMYGCESWTIRKAERKRIEAFELWCWRRLLRVPWTARRSNRSVLEEISPDCPLEVQILKMKFKYFGHLMRRKDSLEKSLMLGTIDGKRRRGRQRMRWLDGVTEAVGLKAAYIISPPPSYTHSNNPVRLGRYKMAVTVSPNIPTVYANQKIDLARSKWAILPFHSNEYLSMLKGMQPALHQESPLDPKGSQKEVEPDSSKAITLEKCHEETKAHKNHHMDILECCNKDSTQADSDMPVAVVKRRSALRELLPVNLCWGISSWQGTGHAHCSSANTDTSQASRKKASMPPHSPKPWGGSQKRYKALLKSLILTVLDYSSQHPQSAMAMLAREDEQVPVPIACNKGLGKATHSMRMGLLGLPTNQKTTKGVGEKKGQLGNPRRLALAPKTEVRNIEQSESEGTFSAI
ncbi:RNA-directed DNA polymerase from mobile element jockey [Varanus komodoensis]|nr:RNA-directed DNA polymerase from mobile element jockey [Varanus komodoensis]